MDLSLTRHVDEITVRRIKARAGGMAASSPILASTLKAAAATAAGNAIEALEHVMDALGAIDGKAVPGELAAVAREEGAALIAALPAIQNCQACIVWGLVTLIGRIGSGASPYDIGRIMGGLHAQLGMMKREQTGSALAA